MFEDFAFREEAVRGVTNQIGVYALCDLDGVPVYVGQSRDGIRSRVRRHLTSARSDIIANRQIDVWEIAYVEAFPVERADELSAVESLVFHQYDANSQLMNGTVPPPPQIATILAPSEKVQILSTDELDDRRTAPQRLPRQARHYSNMVDHYLTVKNSDQMARAMRAHFERLARYHNDLLQPE